MGGGRGGGAPLQGALLALHCTAWWYTSWEFVATDQYTGGGRQAGGQAGRQAGVSSRTPMGYTASLMAACRCFLTRPYVNRYKDVGDITRDLAKGRYEDSMDMVLYLVLLALLAT